ncbi:MAG: hypothetical protein ACI9YB_002385 [Halioglobus sp.]|jgi:hypothetical protein
MRCLSSISNSIKRLFNTDPSVHTSISRLKRVNDSITKLFQVNTHKKPANSDLIEKHLKLYAASITSADNSLSNTSFLNKITSTFLKIFCIKTEYSKYSSQLQEHKNSLKSYKNAQKNPDSPVLITSQPKSSKAASDLKETLDNLQMTHDLLKSSPCQADNEKIQMSISCADSLLASLKGTAAEKTSAYTSVQRKLKLCNGYLSKIATSQGALSSFQATPPSSPSKAGKLGRAITRSTPRNHNYTLSTLYKQGGIPNRGNTCYLASSMQMMARFFPALFTKQLDTDTIRGGDGVIQAVDSPQRLAERKRFQRVAAPMVQLLNGKSDIQNIDVLARAIQGCQIIPPHFGDQECALQVMEGMLMNLGAPRLKLEKSTAIATTPKMLNEIRDTGELQGAEIIPGNAYNIDPIVMPKLSISDGRWKAKTIEEALDHDLRSIVEGYRDNAGLHNERLINGVHICKYDTETLPDTLPIALKRFAFDKNTFSNSKIQNSVKVGDILTIPAKHTKQGDKDVNYRLKGYVMHSGGTGGGHYRAYFKEGEKWFHADDSSVQPTSEGRRKSEQDKGYIYVYERIKD